jgi:hypothetical protein
MEAPEKNSEELRERAVRLVFESKRRSRKSPVIGACTRSRCVTGCGRRKPTRVGGVTCRRAGLAPPRTISNGVSARPLRCLLM